MFWFNNADDKNKFASISAKKWEEVSATLEFSEMVIAASEAKYRLYMVLTKDVTAMGKDANDKFVKQTVTDIPLYLDFKRKASTYKGKTTEQSRLEKFVCTQLEAMDTTKVYKGSISLQDSPMLQMVIDGVTATGQPVDEATKTMLLSTMWNVTEGEASKLNPAECEPPKAGSGGGGYNNSQTEADKLSDRLNFIKAQLALVCPDIEAKTIYDLTTPGLAKNGVTDPSLAMFTIDACLKLMGCQSWHHDDINGKS